MKIDFIYGTRPEFIKMAIPISTFRSHKDFFIRVISTGQHKEMLFNIEFWFGIQPDFCLEAMKSNQSLAGLSSSLMRSFQQFYESHEKPDWIFVQGDTTSAFIASLIGFYSGIKVAHIEAGLRTYDKASPWPEEVNRQLISKLSDFHFAPTERSKQNLIVEGISENAILVTGNTVVDAVEFSMKKINELEVFPESLAPFFTGEFQSEKLILITSHRRENLGEKLDTICLAVQELAESNPDIHFIFPVHLNPQVKESVERFFKVKKENIWLISPLSYHEFLVTMRRSYLILTDSGGLQEEAPSFQKPVLLLRSNTERPEGVENGCVKLIGVEHQVIVDEVNSLVRDKVRYMSMTGKENPFGDGKSSERILEKMISLGKK